MTKEQYLKVVESIIKSPRNDLQKIAMLKYSFETYVEDNRSMAKKQVLEIIQDEIISVKSNFPFTHDDEVKLDKLADVYSLIDSIVKE
jgi:hypothetical protein